MAVLVALLIAAFYYLAAPRNTVASQVASDSVKDLSRFTAANSVDIGMAMGLVTHDPPQMLNPPKQGPPLLLFPPSDADLARLSGP